MFSSGIQSHVIKLRKLRALGLFFILNCRMFVGKAVYWENSFAYRPWAVQLNTKWVRISLRYFYRTPTVSSDTIIIIIVILRAEWLPITDIPTEIHRPKRTVYLLPKIICNTNENVFQFSEWFSIIIYVTFTYSTILSNNNNYHNVNNILNYMISKR